MRFWLSKSSEVPLSEQITIQVILGIVSADLVEGEQLPSTSELARRFHLHPNSVRAAYRELVKGGWLEWRRGSGFYVRALHTVTPVQPELKLDHMISTFLQSLREQGYSLSEIQSRISRSLSLQPPDHVLLIEPDVELRRILVAEISNSISMPVVGVSVEDCSRSEKLVGGLCVALYDSAKEVQTILPPETYCLFLHSRSISKTLTGKEKPPEHSLITVLSRWPKFLQWARTVLVAAEIDPEMIDLRDARKKGWERGLKPRDILITDTVLAPRLSKMSPWVFQILSDESIAELQAQLR